MLSTLKTFAIDYTTGYDPVIKGSEQADSWLSGGSAVAFWIISIAVIIFMIAAMWRVFTKAGRPGWAAIIPIYNTYVTIKIAGQSGWWLLAYFIPVINIVAAVFIMYHLAKVFGKGIGYTLLLIFLPIIGLPMLAWGNAKYKKPRK